jgi:hypothetical protein
MVRRGLGVGGAGREQRRCGLAGASARQEMTRGLAVLPSSPPPKIKKAH